MIDSLWITIVATGIIFFSLISERLRNVPVTPPMVFLIFGLVVGGFGQRLVPIRWNQDSISILGELTLIIVLFSDASRLDLKLLYREFQIPLRLLVLGLPFSIVLGTFFAHWLFPDFGMAQAAVLATIVAPTDAALAHAFVANPKVAGRIRRSIITESGLNDGLCLPLLLIFLCIARVQEHPEMTSYLFRSAAWQITLGPPVGIGLGWLAVRSFEFAIYRNWMSQSNLKIATIVLAFAAYGGAELAGGNGFIAAFCSGLTVGHLSRSARRAIHEFAETEGQLLTLVLFFFVGATLAPTAIQHASIPGAAFAVLALTFMRMVPSVLSLTGTRVSMRNRCLVGWFGPRGVATIVFALTILGNFEIPAKQNIVSIALLTVVISVVAHGLSSNFLAKQAEKPV